MLETGRQDTIKDVDSIFALTQPLAAKHILIKRSRSCLKAQINNFIVISRNDAIIVCAVLCSCQNNKIGELACLIVSQAHQDLGKSKILLSAIEKQSRYIKLNYIYAVTTKTEHWFIKQGFQQEEITDLTIEKQNSYNDR